MILSLKYTYDTQTSPQLLKGLNNQQKSNTYPSVPILSKPPNFSFNLGCAHMLELNIKQFESINPESHKLKLQMHQAGRSQELGKLNAKKSHSLDIGHSSCLTHLSHIDFQVMQRSGGDDSTNNSVASSPSVNYVKRHKKDFDKLLFEDSLDLNGNFNSPDTIPTESPKQQSLDNKKRIKNDDSHTDMHFEFDEEELNSNNSNQIQHSNDVLHSVGSLDMSKNLSKNKNEELIPLVSDSQIVGRMLVDQSYTTQNQEIQNDETNLPETGNNSMDKDSIQTVKNLWKKIIIDNGPLKFGSVLQYNIFKLSVKNEILNVISNLQMKDEFKIIGSKIVTQLEGLFSSIIVDGKIDLQKVRILGYYFKYKMTTQETQNVNLSAILMTVKKFIGDECKPEMIQAFSQLQYSSILI